MQFPSLFLCDVQLSRNIRVTYFFRCPPNAKPSYQLPLFVEVGISVSSTFSEGTAELLRDGDSMSLREQR